MDPVKRYIISGGPGAGKTTLLEALKQLNYPCFDEVSRQLITEQVAGNTGCLPWTDLPCFAGKALQRMTGLHRQAACCHGATFFDRGIPDIIAYLKVAGLPVAENYYTALLNHPYQHTVFMLPPWKEIYVNDPERWQTFREATAIYEVLQETYQALNYTLVEIKKGPVHQRVQQITRIVTTA